MALVRMQPYPINNRAGKLDNLEPVRMLQLQLRAAIYSSGSTQSDGGKSSAMQEPELGGHPRKGILWQKCGTPHPVYWRYLPNFHSASYDRYLKLAF